MSKLVVFPEHNPGIRLVDTRDDHRIAEELQAISARFERWDASAALADGAGQEEVLAAYRREVDLLILEGGFRGADVVRFRPDPGDPGWPEEAWAARQKFLEEHIHAEDEVRLCVDGSGVFYLRAAGRVHALLCERGDLLSVPAGTRHWFDMGTNPRFCAIRLLTSPEGWTASFTGDPIARSFPEYDAIADGGAGRSILRRPGAGGSGAAR